MGDGGFWHNGLSSGIANAVFNKQDESSSSSIISIRLPLVGRTSCRRGHQPERRSTNNSISRP